MTGRIICAESGSGKTTLAAKNPNLLDTDALFRVWCAAACMDGWEILRDDPESYADFVTQAAKFYAPFVLTGGWVLTWDVYLAKRLSDEVVKLKTIVDPEPYLCAYAYRDIKDLLSAKHMQYTSKNPPKEFNNDESICEGHHNFLASVMDLGIDLRWIPKGKHLGDLL